MNQNQINLGLAAASGDIYLVKECIEKGCNDFDKPYNGMTPLCLASFWGNNDIVEFLLEKGANVNTQSPQTLWTATHCASFQGHGKVLLTLLEYGPDMTLKDKEQRTAIDFASASDAIWPFFANLGYKRTSKADLIAKKIIYKLSEQQTNQTVYQSRPGSAYGIRDVSFEEASSRSQRSYNGGDILASTIEEDNDEIEVREKAPNNTESSKKNFDIWNLNM